MPAIYLVWKGYQRRAELLGPKLGARVVYLPHLFRSKMLRPLDYLVKFVRSIHIVWVAKANLVFVQCPPIYGGMVPLLLRVPYVVDAHNSVWRGFWNRLPLTGLILRKARAVMVHNTEIYAVARPQLPVPRLVVVRDPIAPIRWPVCREPERVLFICSFDPGEPIDLTAEVIAAMPQYHFYITADPRKLSGEIRDRLMSLPNLTLTGFLPTEQYQQLLCSSSAAVVLEEAANTQPSGACEALASDTPLVLSFSTLTQDLFGGWAHLVEHRTPAITAAIRDAAVQHLDLAVERQQWSREVEAAVAVLRAQLGLETANNRRFL